MAGLAQNPVRSTGYDEIVIGIEVALDGSNAPTVIHGMIPLDPTAPVVHTSTGLFTFQLNQNKGNAGLTYLAGMGGIVVGAHVRPATGGSAPALVDIVAVPYGLANITGSAVNVGSAAAPKAGQFQIQLFTPGGTSPVDPPAKATNACNLQFLLILFDTTQQD